MTSPPNSQTLTISLDPMVIETPPPELTMLIFLSVLLSANILVNFYFEGSSQLTCADSTVLLLVHNVLLILMLAQKRGRHMRILAITFKDSVFMLIMMH